MEQQEFVSPSVELEPEDERSAFDRFAAVFTSPTEAFEGLAEVAKKGKIILWGLLITLVVTSFTVVLFSSNPELREGVQQKQMEKVEEMHDNGKMSDAQYKQQAEAMEAMSGTGIFIAFGLVFGFIGTALFAVLIGLLVFVLVKIFQRDSASKAGFTSALAATVISFMIMNVENIITAVGMFLTSNMDFRISPTLFVQTDNDFVKYALNLINPFMLWMWFALGTAVAVLSRSERTKSIAAVAGVWFVGGLIITGIGSLLGNAFGG